MAESKCFAFTTLEMTLEVMVYLVRRQEELHLSARLVWSTSKAGPIVGTSPSCISKHIKHDGNSSFLTRFLPFFDQKCSSFGPFLPKKVVFKARTSTEKWTRSCGFGLGCRGLMGRRSHSTPILIMLGSCRTMHSKQPSKYTRSWIAVRS